MKRYITCQITSEGYVAIWWYDDVQDKIIGAKCLVSEGVEDRGYVQYSKVANHMNLWKAAVEDGIDDSRKQKLLNSSYRSLERGRVVFDIKTQCYQIICSSAIASNKKVIKLIAEECNLLDKQVMIIPDVHYDNNAVDMLELFTE